MPKSKLQSSNRTQNRYLNWSSDQKEGEAIGEAAQPSSHKKRMKPMGIQNRITGKEAKNTDQSGSEEPAPRNQR
jgi:hypothetical protein